MKIKKPNYLNHVALCVLLLTATANAHAQFFVGVSAGQSKAALSGGDLSSQLLDLGFSSSAVSLGDKTTGYGLKLGYQFTPNIAVEANYIDLSKYSYQAAIQPTGGLNSGLYSAFKAKGFGLDLVGALPIFDRFSLLGRAGIQRVKADGAFSGPGSIDLVSYGASQSSTSGRLAFGVQYAMSKDLGLRLEVERFRKLGGNALGSAFDADNYSLGVLFKF